MSLEHVGNPENPSHPGCPATRADPGQAAGVGLCAKLKVTACAAQVGVTHSRVSEGFE